ncbi:MAG: hypothetical protein M3Z24_08625 [Chloroflexota bacterium]|nr:hypothetical protein [Chloroflexota bacterium]
MVGHSMGGLIIRDAIYGVSTHQSIYPPTLGSISDVVTFATPHGGIDPVRAYFAPCHDPNKGYCTEVSEMAQGGSFMNYMIRYESNPQAANGTDWTMMGDNQCDLAVTGEVANYMAGGHHSVFSINNGFAYPCYSHGPGSGSYMEDTNDANDATIYWCDGGGCSLDYQSYPNWNQLNSAPHSLHHMMYALWLPNW